MSTKSTTNKVKHILLVPTAQGYEVYGPYPDYASAKAAGDNCPWMPVCVIPMQSPDLVKQVKAL